MANNTVLQQPTVSGDTCRTIDKTAYKTPVSLIDIGGTSTESLVEASNPLPVYVRSELVDDAAFTPATSRVMMMGATFDNSAPDSVDEGDGGAVRMSANRCLYVNIRDNAGNERGLNIDSSGNLTIGTVTAVTSITNPVTVTNSGTFAVQAVCTNAGTFAVQESGAALTALQSIDDAVYTDGTGTPLKGIAVMGTDGTNPQLMSVNATGHVNIADGGNSITVDNAGTFAVQAVCTNAGTFAVQATCTNAGTFAVQVDGAALTALQVIDNLVLAEDAVHNSGDPGVQVLVVRKDSGTALAGTDGDYSPLQVDSSGNLRVNVAAGGAGDGAILDGVSSSIKATVLDYTNSNPLAVRLTDTSGDYVGAGAGTQYTEDAAAAADPIGTALIMVRADSLAAVTSADGDNIAARATNKGELYVKHADTIAATQSGTWNVGTVTTITNTVTVDTELPAAAALADNTANPTVPGVGAYLMVWDTATWDRAPGNSTDGLTVNLGTNNDVTVTGTVGVSGTVAVTQSGTWNLTTCSTVTTVSTVTAVTDITNPVTVKGDVAHDSADSNNPTKIGAKATTSLSGITLVADADRTNLFAGVDGVQITRPHCNLEDIVTGVASITDGSSTSVISAAGANVKIYITSVIISNSSGSNVTVDLRDGTAGTVKATFPAPTVGGVVHSLAVPLPFSANTAVAADPSASASTVTVTLIGFKSKV